jgi:oxazoline/thiazoline synthase
VGVVSSRPRFKSSLEPVIEPGVGLFLLSEERFVWLADPVFAAVAPMLDGVRDVEDIFLDMSKAFPMGQVFIALDHLRTAGYLAEGPLEDPRSATAFWEHAGACPEQVRGRLGGGAVSIVTVGDADVGCLSALFEEHGIAVTDNGAVSLVITDDYLRPELATWNRLSLESGKPWLLVKPIGLEAWLGPHFVPGRSACWACLAQRLRGHRKLEGYIARRQCRSASLAARPAWIPSMRHAALAEAVTAITRWIGTNGQSALFDRVVSTNVLTLERTHHLLTRRPQCEACGVLGSSCHAGVFPVRLQPRRKLPGADGGHRATDGHTVRVLLERHLSPITGIVSALVPGERTAFADAGGGPITTTLAADHNFSDLADDRFFLGEGLRRRSGGKGKTPEQVRLSALAESVERYSGVFDGTEPRIRATYDALNGAAIHPNTCMSFSRRQFSSRNENNMLDDRTRWVPLPFRENEEIEWTPLWSLSKGTTRYLPTSYCYYGYRSDDPLFARGDSNGCASGAVLEEAVLQGFLELVERDAVAIWWYNRLRRPGVDLDSMGDAYVGAFVREYHRLQRNVWVLDVTSDLGIPTFAAISKRYDKAEEDIIYGFGAHLDPAVAVVRALTELNQSLEAVPIATGPASMQSYRGSAESIKWWRSVTTVEAAYLVPDPLVPLQQLSEMRSLASEDLRDDITVCLDRAAARGIEIFVLDQTRPDVGFPVVRVVAPGLRHFWARFGPGRLYDVPLQQGWLDRPLKEDELNPFVVQF